MNYDKRKEEPLRVWFRRESFETGNIVRHLKKTNTTV